MSRSFAILVFTSLLIVGCGGDDTPPPYVIPDGGRAATDGGVPLPNRDAGPLPDAAVNSNGPIVSVVSPTPPPIGDYTSDAILVSDRVSIRCSASQNPAGDTLERSSVVAVVHDSAGRWVEVPALPAGVSDEFQAEISLLDFPGGAISVRCQASDINGLSNSDEISTFVDRGPVIQIFSPMTGVTYGQQVDVVFTVTAAPVAMDDSLAGVDYGSVMASLAGLPLMNITRNGDTFEGTVLFEDPYFGLPLLGEHRLLVQAENLRTAVATATSADVTFQIDDAMGPEIIVEFPTPAEIVSGVVTVRARIEDLDGVVAGATVATIAGVEFPMVELSPGVFEGSFDTHRLGAMMVFPTIIVRAQDGFGNQSQNGFVVTLDNRGPRIDLDPPEDFREALAVGEELYCSNSFDPVGPDAQNDGDLDVRQLSKYRARVEDMGNGDVAMSEPFTFVQRAGVDSGDVQVYILDWTTLPIVVDINGDGFCDELNPHLVPTTVPVAMDEMARIDLVAVAPDGEPQFTGQQPVAQCTFDSRGSWDSICPITSPGVGRYIAAPDGETPVIYAIPPVTELSCMGNPFDSLATNISDGWACLAVRAVDKIGNVGVSKPLRICYDHDGSGGDCAGPMPDCTGTYDPVTDTVDPGTPCSQEFSFPSGEIRYVD